MRYSSTNHPTCNHHILDSLHHPALRAKAGIIGISRRRSTGIWQDGHPVCDYISWGRFGWPNAKPHFSMPIPPEQRESCEDARPTKSTDGPGA
jgi:hypothetical protein